jgi:hypothetical protein
MVRVSKYTTNVSTKSISKKEPLTNFVSFLRFISQVQQALVECIYDMSIESDVFIFSGSYFLPGVCTEATCSLVAHIKLYRN